ncbi:hypothetical protein N9D31_00970, partial [Oligoflexaceae bacterium]|nr:hypothetical protein [Oligoflexaceae bacterium]
MRLLSVILVSFISLYITSCEKAVESESGVESLDNFATGEAKGFATNQCVGTSLVSPNLFKFVAPQDYAQIQPVDFKNHVVVLQHEDVSSVDNQSKEAFRQAYSALPLEMRNLFKAFRVKFRLTNNTKDLCGFAYSSDDSEKNYLSDRDKSRISACWRAIKITGRNHKSIEIVLKANAEDIGHYLVRQSAYLYSQYFSYLEGTSDVLRSVGANASPQDLQRLQRLYHGHFPDQEFITLKSQLTAAFMQDMVNPKDPSFKLSNLDYILGNGA